MKNEEKWRPTKFVEFKNRLRASRDTREVSIGSRLVADLVADFYQEKVPQFVKGSLLDLGCGKAPLYGLYKRHATSVTCVDWQNSLHGADYLDHTMDLNQPLRLEDSSFDTVILSDVLEHIVNPALLVSEISRVLRPSGTLIMNVPFFYWLHEVPHDYYRYTEYALRRFMQQADLTVIHLKPTGGAIEILGDVSSKLIAKAPVVGGTTANILQRACYLFSRTRLGGRVSAKTMTTFPLGYGLIAKK
jgi:SAM-dependent methyltransferase